MSKPEHVKQIVEWGAEGVICGSALVKALGESGSPVSDENKVECRNVTGRENGLLM